MSILSTTGRDVKGLAAVEADLVRRGFTPGVPAHVRPDTAAIDRRLCRRSRCPGCRKGRDYRPFGRAADRRYKIVAACAACNHAEEM